MRRTMGRKCCPPFFTQTPRAILSFAVASTDSKIEARVDGHFCH